LPYISNPFYTPYPCKPDFSIPFPQRSPNSPNISESVDKNPPVYRRVFIGQARAIIVIYKKRVKKATPLSACWQSIAALPNFPKVRN
jgi:hypothetical protein